MSFTECPTTSDFYTHGGRHVEFGAGYMMAKLCVIVGPQENVFHYLPGVVVLEDEDQLLTAIDRWAEREKVQAAHNFAGVL